MESPLQEIRTPQSTRRQKSSRRLTLCPATIKATSAKLKEVAEFQCPNCGPSFITFPDQNGEQICGDCDAIVFKIDAEEDCENSTPNSILKGQTLPFTVKKKLEKVAEVDFNSPVLMDVSVDATQREIEVLKKEKADLEAQHKETIQDLISNAEEIKRCELASLHESLENEWRGKLEDEVQQMQAQHASEIEGLKAKSFTELKNIEQEQKKSLQSFEFEIENLRNEHVKANIDLLAKHASEIEKTRLETISNLTIEYGAKEKKMCQEHSEEVSKLQFELAENKKQHEIATKELKLSLEGAYKTNLVSDTKKHQEEIKILQDELSTHKEKNEAEWQQRQAILVEKHNSIVESLNETIQNLRDECTGAKSQAEAMQISAEDLRKEVETWKEKFKKQNEINDQLQQQVLSVQSQNTNLIDSNNKVAEKMKHLNTRILEQETRAQSAEKSAEYLQAEKDALVSSNEELRANCDTMKKKHELDLENATKNHEREVKTIRDALSKSDSFKSTFEIERSNFLQEIAFLKQGKVEEKERVVKLKNDIEDADKMITSLNQQISNIKETLTNENMELQRALCTQNEAHDLEMIQAKAFYEEERKSLLMRQNSETDSMICNFKKQMQEQRKEVSEFYSKANHRELNLQLHALEKNMLQQFEVKEAKLNLEKEKSINTVTRNITSKYEAMFADMEAERLRNVDTWKENFLNQQNEVSTLKEIFVAEKEKLQDYYESERDKLQNVFTIELNLHRKSSDRSLEALKVDNELQLKLKDDFYNNLIENIHMDYALTIAEHKKEIQAQYDMIQIRNCLDHLAEMTEHENKFKQDSEEKIGALVAKYEEEKNILKNDFRFVKVALSRQRVKEISELKSTLNSFYEQKMHDEKAQHEKSIASLKQSFETQKSVWEANHNDDIQRKCKSLQDRLEEMTKMMTREMQKGYEQADQRCKEFEARFKTWHEKEIERINEEHKSEIDQLKLGSQLDILQAEHENKIKQMKEEMQTQKVGLLDEMEQMKKRLEGEMFVMMQSNNEEVAKSASLEEKLLQTAKKVETLEEELAEMIKVANGIEEKLSEELKHEKLKSAELEGGIVSKDLCIGELEERCNAMKEKVTLWEKLQHEYELMSTKSKKNDEVICEQKRKIAEFDKLLKSKIRLFEQKLEAKEGQFEQRLRSKDEERKSLKKKLEDQKKKSELFELKFKEHCKKQMSKAKDMYVLEKQKVATLVSEIKNIKTVVTRKEKDIENMMNLNEKMKKDTVDMETKYRQLEAEDKTLKASLFDKSKIITTLNQKNAELNSLCADMMEQLEKYERSEQ